MTVILPTARIIPRALTTVLLKLLLFIISEGSPRFSALLAELHFDITQSNKGLTFNISIGTLLYRNIR